MIPFPNTKKPMSRPITTSRTGSKKTIPIRELVQNRTPEKSNAKPPRSANNHQNELRC
jgi:hypothetical protein